MASVHCQKLDAIEWLDRIPPIVDWAFTAQVFKVNVPGNIPNLNKFRPLLSPGELERAQRYHQEKDRQRYIISRAVLKLLIGHYLELPASDVIFGIGVNKKPLIANQEAGRLQYNLTHAGDWILIAFSHSMIGIDLERIDPLFQYEHLLTTCFNGAEADTILKASDSRMQFYLMWTRKEALVKATGKGIDESLPLVPCMDGRTEIPFLMQGPESWVAASFSIDENHIASVTYPSTNRNIQFIEQDVFALV